MEFSMNFLFKSSMSHFESFYSEIQKFIGEKKYTSRPYKQLMLAADKSYTKANDAWKKSWKVTKIFKTYNHFDGPEGTVFW